MGFYDFFFKVQGVFPVNEICFLLAGIFLFFDEN